MVRNVDDWHMVEEPNDVQTKLCLMVVTKGDKKAPVDKPYKVEYYHYGWMSQYYLSESHEDRYKVFVYKWAARGFHPKWTVDNTPFYTCYISEETLERLSKMEDEYDVIIK